MNFKINAIVFDLGGVLIDWNPDYVYEKVFNGDKKKLIGFMKIYVQWIGMKIKMPATH